MSTLETLRKEWHGDKNNYLSFGDYMAEKYMKAEKEIEGLKTFKENKKVFEEELAAVKAELAEANAQLTAIRENEKPEAVEEEQSPNDPDTSTIPC